MKRASNLLAAFLVALLVLVTACDFATVVPTLASGLSRISVDRVVQCSKLKDRGDRAKCIGAHVGGAALDTALSKAAQLGERAMAADAPTGSESPMSSRDEKRLAKDLDVAMRELEMEIASANAQ